MKYLALAAILALLGAAVPPPRPARFLALGDSYTIGEGLVPAEQETARAGARWVDVTPVSRKAGADRSLLAPDGLHPSGAMYAEWVRLALPEALAALR